MAKDLGGIIESIPSSEIAEDAISPNQIEPTIELPVYGIKPVDRKWWIDQFLSELDHGQFSNAGRLGDAIKRDARILGALEQRNAALFSAPLEITAAKDSIDPETGTSVASNKSMQIRDEIEANWAMMFPRTELEELNQYGIMHGVGIAEKIWDTSKKPWTFRIEPRHPQFYLWLWNTGCYHITTINKGLVKVPRKSSQWMIYAPYGYKRSFLNGRIRALLDPWMFRMWDKVDWANWCERHGKPIIKAIVPQEASVKQEKDYVNSIANMGSSTVIKARQDKDGNKFDVELVEAMSMGWKGFEAMLSWCDKEISNTLLGQSMSTEGVGGLGANDKPGQAVRQDVASSDSYKLCEVLVQQGLRDYCEFNYGNPDLAPSVKYVTDPEEDESKLADKDQKTASALVSFKGAQAPINIREYLEDRGYPLMTETEEKQMLDEAEKKQQDQMKLQKTKMSKEDKFALVSRAVVDLRRAGADVDFDAIIKKFGIPPGKGE